MSYENMLDKTDKKCDTCQKELVVFFNFHCGFCEKYFCMECLNGHISNGWYIHHCDCGIHICSNCIKRVPLEKEYNGKKDKSSKIDGDFKCYDYFTAKKDHQFFKNREVEKIKN